METSKQSRQKPDTPTLGYTGHPFIDIGLATMAAFVDKFDPSELAEEDMEAMAEYMRRNYVVNPLKSFLTVVFPNSGFTQPAFESQPEKREIYSRRVLGSFAVDTPTLAEQDIFLGLPIADVPYDVKGELPSGRAYRQHIPLLTGEGVINFGANGEPGLSISGLGLLAIQAFPLGCAKCMGRLLAVHSDSPDIVWDFASTFLAGNRKLIMLAQQTKSSKLPEAPRSPFTLLVETLLEAGKRSRQEKKVARPFSVTAYHLSNSGQSPSLDIYHLPFPITSFLHQMRRAEYNQKWEQIVSRAWQMPKKKAKQEQGEFVPRYNNVYEDLFRLPEDAARFIRTYFLRIPRQSRDEQDPRATYSIKQEVRLISWDITAEFLKGVMNMDPERVELIRKMGDRLAGYVNQQNDKRFFRSFFTARRYGDLRTILLRANYANLQRGAEPILEFDPYIAIFEDAGELGRADWQLARDLVLIRMTEQLSQLGWLRQNAEDIPEPSETEEPGS